MNRSFQCLSICMAFGVIQFLASSLLVNGYVVKSPPAKRSPHQPFLSKGNSWHPSSTPTTTTPPTTLHMIGGSGQGDYMVKEFSQYEQLVEIVQLASQPIPERPDGIVCVAKFTSARRPECQSTEPDYERIARMNPATIFLRCFEEYDDAATMFGQADIQNFPTYDVFYGGNRVARVDGPNIAELEEVLQMYQFQNSNLDLFSEDASRKRELQWGDGTAKDMSKTPRTTARFVPGYDWGSSKGFFDDQADKAQQSFEDAFGNWVPDIDDDIDIPPQKK